MRSLVSCLIFLAATVHAIAAEPGYYKVTGVASSDVLNIRIAPDPSSDVIGEFAPDASPVEVLEVVTSGAGEWGRVIASDSDGWVSMHFLKPTEVAFIPGTELPSGLQCSGTEPFWDGVLATNNLSFSTIDVAEQSLPLGAAVTTLGRQYRYALVAENGQKRMTAIVAQDFECSDGMSDRHYRWRIDVLRENSEDGDLPAAYEGCCRLPVR
ncbi:MAG: SH3 domain-containing protein [Nitratireductor sp.]|nr:SH3 domain-containing protein [Nitratireductor sp.]